MDSSHHFPLRRFQFPIRFKMTGAARLVGNLSRSTKWKRMYGSLSNDAESHRDFFKFLLAMPLRESATDQDIKPTGHFQECMQLPILVPQSINLKHAADVC